jgi:hypothetical protein
MAESHISLAQWQRFERRCHTLLIVWLSAFFAIVSVAKQSLLNKVLSVRNCFIATLYQ